MCGLRTCSCHLTFQLNTVNTVWPVRFKRRRILVATSSKLLFKNLKTCLPKREISLGCSSEIIGLSHLLKTEGRDNTIPTNSDTVMCGSHAWGSITSITRIQDNCSRNSVLLEGIRRMCVCVFIIHQQEQLNSISTQNSPTQNTPDNEELDTNSWSYNVTYSATVGNHRNVFGNIR